jgi:hypothetical protein
VHVRPERLRDEDASVFQLAILQDGHHGPPHGEAGTVQGVHEPCLALSARPVSNGGPASLEVLEITARRNLAVEALPGQPDLDVVGLGRTESHVTGAKDNDPVVDPELPEHLFRVPGQGLQLIVGVLGPDELDQLDLVELMETYEPPRVLPMGSRLFSEAWRVSRISFWWMFVTGTSAVGTR